MTPYIDKRLIDQISAAGEFGQVEVVIVVKEREGSPLAQDEGLARRVIEAAIERTGEHPSAVRYVPRANAAGITARGKLIQEILKDENLVVASATDVQVVVFSADP